MASLPAIEHEKTIAETWDDLGRLLCTWAIGLRPDREAAGRYMICRTALLAARISVPGFLIQCGSIYKFCDFMNLYDPRLEARLAFLEATFREWHPLPQVERVRDIFHDFER